MSHDQTTDMTPSRGIDRRTVVRTTAWGIPAVSLAGVAPAFAGSGTPVCPTVFEPGILGVVGATGSRAPFSSPASGNVLMTGALGIDSSGGNLSLFQPAYTMVTTGAQLTMSNGQTYNSTVDATVGAGTFGQISAFTPALAFPNVNLPNDPVGAPYNPRPTRITLNVNMILVGLPSLITITCPQTLVWDLNFVGAGSITTALGGAVAYTGTVTPRPDLSS